MNCRDWEERLALYAGGDLPKDEAVQVERHLGECPGCQLFSSGMTESQELLQQWHREPPAPVHLAAVRARVLAELERERRPFWRRGWVFGFAAAAAALLVAPAVLPPVRSLLAPGHRPGKPPEGASEHPPVSLLGVTKQRDEGVPRGPGGPPHQRSARPKAQPGEPMLIRMVSDNPDVVIYWIADTRGE
jgi:hypothetical protein